MKRQQAWPEGHWDWPIGISHKHGFQLGDMIFVGGQVDLTSEGEVRNHGDLAAQTANAMAYFGDVLQELGAGLEDLVKLLCFYVDDGAHGEQAFLEMVGQALPEGSRPAVTAVPVPYLAYEGMVVEIEGIAMRGEDGAPLPRSHAQGKGASPLPEPFVQAVRCGKMIHVSGQAPVVADGKVLHGGDIVAQTNEVMRQLADILSEFGAGFEDVVKINRWYAGADSIDDFEPAALACAAHFAEPGPCATGIPLPRHAEGDVHIKIEAVAMLAEDGRSLPRRHVWPESAWDWHVHLPYKHGLQCGDMIFVGGQVSLDTNGRAVHPDQLAEQTHVAMQHIGAVLEELGAGFPDVGKVLTLYAGSCGADDIHTNLSIRSSYFKEPGPASTGVPLPALAYPGMVIEIEVYGRVDDA